MALCVLYFLHELIHLQQGIGELETVQIVRSTGAEMTLMHLDLSADHAACLLTNTAFPRWDLLWLKNLTGRSLSAFPASTFHTQAARHRKAAPLVPTEANLLWNAADPAVKLDEVDEVLRRALKHDG